MSTPHRTVSGFHACLSGLGSQQIGSAQRNIMTILGIDPSYHNTGWCIIESNEECFTVLKAGSIPVSLYRSKKRAKEYTEAQNISKIAFTIDFIILNQRCPLIDAVAIEKAPPVSRAGAGLLQQILGAIKAVVGQKLLDYKEFYPMTVKKLVTGFGGAEKIEVEKAIEEKLTERHEFRNYDESDACAIAMAYWIDMKNDNDGGRRSN